MEEPESVLVVGAGPVGPALANDLGQRGIACLILERSSAPTGSTAREGRRR